MTVRTESFSGDVGALVAAANRTLAGVSAVDRRVAPAVDVRTVRWYTSSGLLPAAQRDGRSARYGPEHLERLVAIRRLQAEGWTLSGIQRLLAEIDSDRLRAIARGTEQPAADAFWTRRPTAPAADPTGLRHPERPGSVLVLADGVRLVLDRPLPADRLAAVVAAAQPMLDVIGQPHPRRSS
ncbi:MAG TPA: helix-turn-helix domain-containing protein [Acidimicrobiales bacterium]